MAKDNILTRVTQFAGLHNLLPPPPATVYVGFSGGPDSVALLHILWRMGYSCHALHCNFHLRGKESDRDELFCRQFCRQLGITITVREFDTRSYMQEHHLSLEMAARRLRYDWWATIVNAPLSIVSSQSTIPNSTPIALGHHQDDSIETALMNLMRGTGLQGLTGIVPRNARTHVVRPLLCLTRQDIMDYLHDYGLSYVIDSTNGDCDTLRNQIRHQLLPLMEQLVPQARHGIALTMANIRHTAHWAERHLATLDHLTRHYDRWGVEWDEISIAQLSQHIAAEEVEAYLYEWQRRHCRPDTHRAVRTATLLYTEPTDGQLIARQRPHITIRHVVTPPTADQWQALPASTICLDADTVTPPLGLRPWQRGDRMAPLGMHGRTKLVSDLFTNAHYSPMLKATTWLLHDATGSILWVVGLRTSHHSRITAHTQRTIMIQLIGSTLTDEPPSPVITYR